MEAFIQASPTSVESARSNRADKKAPTKNSGYFMLDSQEILGSFGPALTDTAAAGYAARFLQASDDIDYTKIKANTGPLHPLTDLSPAGYFAYEDADMTHEILGLLGPALTDAEVSGYMAHLLA